MEFVLKGRNIYNPRINPGVGGDNKQRKPQRSVSLENKMKTMSKRMIIVICLLGCISMFWANRHSQQKDPGKETFYTVDIEMDDETELVALVNISSRKHGGFLIVVSERNLKPYPNISTGPWSHPSHFSQEDEIRWIINTQPDTSNERSHAVPKNSVCCVRKSNHNIVTLLTLTDKTLVQGLTDMNSSDAKEEQELARNLFESLIRYAYKKKFSSNTSEISPP